MQRIADLFTKKEQLWIKHDKAQRDRSCSLGAGKI
jgi:hypothetical protein